MHPSYALGLFFIVCVSFIWSIASMVTQFLYDDENFDSPFLLTYIATSLFILLLPSRLLWERRQQCCCYSSTRQEGLPDEVEIIPWRANSTTYQNIVAAEPTGERSQVMDKANGAADTTHHRDDVRMWSHAEHFQTALHIAPFWFGGNWAYNASLEYTSITSSTVLASTGSLFTFLFALLWKDEKFSVYKFIGVLLGISGSILTAMHDVGSYQGDEDVTSASVTMNATMSPSTKGDPNQGHALWGDMLGVIASAAYGIYAVMIHNRCPHDERCMSMQLILGYIGLINAVLLSPIALYVLITPPASSGDGDDDSTATTAQRLTLVVFGCLVGQGLINNVLSDYLWARSVVLTSATVATVGLGLTIPLAFVSDWIMGHGDIVSPQSVLGALSVLVGFVIVNLGSQEEEDVVDDEAIINNGLDNGVIECLD